MQLPTSSRSRALKLGALAAVGVMLTACGGMSSMDHSSQPGASMSGHPMTASDGLSAESGGMRLTSTAGSLPAGQATTFTFQITGPDRKPITQFETDQTKLMHVYLIRSDLTGFQHVHPVMSADGIWTAQLNPLEPGRYRAYASFIAKATGTPLVLSREETVVGNQTPTPLPNASTTTTVDGFAVTLATDQLMAGMSHELDVTVTRDGNPVTDLEPYLETYAHLTAFHEGDLAIAHLHPHGSAAIGSGGPKLTFEANLPKAGQWRLFIQFQTGGQLHTAAVTVNAS